MVLLQINECLNASTGKIARQIGDLAVEAGYESYIAYSAWEEEFPCKSKLIKIGNKYDRYFHALETRVFDNHGLASRKATKELVKQICVISPDLIHLHLVHGYYLNYIILFECLREINVPVIWTFHDCWAFTGHCGFFFSIKGDDCEKWMTGCNHCNLLNEYPKSIYADRTKKNWELKKYVFNSLPELTIVAVSDWIKTLTEMSFLKNNRVERIYNGIDVNLFAPTGKKNDVLERYEIGKDNKLILGVANVWEKRKGFTDFCYLSSKLPSNVTILLVGVSEKQAKSLPQGMLGIKRTENVQQLAELYSAADIFVNPTYADNFPTTNLEALSCGTPVITYRTGGSPEAIDEHTGIVTDRGDIDSLYKNILLILNEWNLEETAKYCRDRALKLYNQNTNFHIYLDLYKKIIEKHNG